MNYKPFDLQKALAGEPVVRKHLFSDEYQTVVKILHFPKNSYRNQFLLFHNVNGNTTSEWIGNDDAFNWLFMAPKEIEYWVATGEDEAGVVLSGRPAIDQEVADRNIRQFVKTDTIQYHQITRFE